MSDKKIVETVKYKGFDINIVEDDSGVNPFDDDYEFPFIMCNFMQNGRDNWSSHGKGDMDSEPPVLTCQEILDNKDVICNIIARSGYDGIDFNADMWDDDINNSILECFKYGNATVEDLTDLHNCKEDRTAVFHTSRGHCQGDYAEVIIIITNEWLKAYSGADISKDDHGQYTEEVVNNTVMHFDAWAWGDVYGYIIEEIEDNSYGYYGSNHENSDLIPSAKESIDYEYNCYRMPVTEKTAWDYTAMSLAIKYDIKLPKNIEIMKICRILYNKYTDDNSILEYITLKCDGIENKEDAEKAIDLWKLEKL